MRLFNFFCLLFLGSGDGTDEFLSEVPIGEELDMMLGDGWRRVPLLVKGHLTGLQEVEGALVGGIGFGAVLLGKFRRARDGLFVGPLAQW